MNRAPVRSFEYVAAAHLDEDVRRIAEIMIAHGDDPWVAAERIAEWAEHGVCIHGEQCSECWL